MGETPVYKNAIPSYFSSDVIVMWSLCLCSTFRWVSQKTEITRSQLIVLSTVFFFSAFWKHGGQVGESPSSPLEISKTAKFEGHCWKRTKYSSSKSCLRANVTYFLCCNKRNRRRLHAGNSKSCRTLVLWWGLKLALPPPLPNIQTSVKFRNFAELNLRSLKTYHFQIWH